MNETITEYGLRRSDGGVSWPDGDAEIYVRDVGYVPATVVDLQRALSEGYEPGTSIVERSYSVKVHLPEAVGSVIRAQYEGQGERVLFVRADTDGFPWVKIPHGPEVDDLSWGEDEALGDVEVLFVGPATEV